MLVAESNEIVVSQGIPRRLRWNMAGLNDEKLRTAKRLEIVWYLQNHPPDGSHRGQGRGSFDYEGRVLFDDIRLTNDVRGRKRSHGARRNVSSTGTTGTP